MDDKTRLRMEKNIEEARIKSDYKWGLFKKKYPTEYEITSLEEPGNVICDICNGSCKKELNIESGILFSTWGYGSNKDEESHYCNMCESCYDKVVCFINSIGGNIRRVNYVTGEEILNDE